MSHFLFQYLSANFHFADRIQIVLFFAQLLAILVKIQHFSQNQHIYCSILELFTIFSRENFRLKNFFSAVNHTLTGNIYNIRKEFLYKKPPAAQTADGKKAVLRASAELCLCVFFQKLPDFLYPLRRTFAVFSEGEFNIHSLVLITAQLSERQKLCFFYAFIVLYKLPKL